MKKCASDKNDDEIGKMQIDRHESKFENLPVPY
jgi:hypothetical protein